MPLLDKKRKKFTEIYSDYYQIVYGAIYSKTASITDSDELTQEVFMLYYSKMESVENVRAWLLGTVNNILMNFYRKKKKMSSEDIEQHLNDVSVTFVNGFRDTRLILDEAVNSLGGKDRVLFDLVAVQNLTIETAASHLGITRRQAQYRYSLALRDIRALLGEKGIRNIEDLL